MCRWIKTFETLYNCVCERYEFKADPAGTHWYHAHTGLQREDGVYGPIIIRQAEDPHSALYDHDLPEQTVMVTEWNPVPSVARYMDLMHHFYDDLLPVSALINGKNRHHKVYRLSFLVIHTNYPEYNSRI